MPLAPFLICISGLKCLSRTFHKSALLGTANILRKVLNFLYEVINLIERTISDKSSSTKVYCENNNNNNNNSSDAG